MAISGEDAERLTQTLEARVREFATAGDRYGILNLLNQWRADVEAGKPIERRLTVKSSPGIDRLSDLPLTPTTTSGDFVGRKDFSPMEKLEMLVSTIGIALVAPAMMADRILGTITRISRNAGSMEAIPVTIERVGFGETGELPFGRRISSDTVEQSLSNTIALSALLHEIATEANFRTLTFSTHRGRSRDFSE